jgi:hypothetical protein
VRRRFRLTSKFVNNADAGYHPDGDGLYLRVTPTLSKSWIFRYQLNGPAREVGLGGQPFRRLSAGVARARADLDGEAGNRRAAARPDRTDARLGAGRAIASATTRRSAGIWIRGWAKLKRRELVEHHAALPYDDLPESIQRLRERPGTAGLTMLNIAHTAAVTTIPAERMKAHPDHRVPLFAGRFNAEPMSNMAMAKARAHGQDEVTVHGFRSTFRDWAAEVTNHPHEVCEMALAHTICGKTRLLTAAAIFSRSAAALMLEWARYCEAPKRIGKVLLITKQGTYAR